MSPLANSFLDAEQVTQPETFYPLHAYVCDACFLVQVMEFQAPEVIFKDYAYFSSYSESWLQSARRFAEEMIERLGLDAASRVIEIASNDGYLLQYFKQSGIPVLGIEPAANVAQVAQAAGIHTLIRFFGSELARELGASGIKADLLVANNVLAHVPDLNDFVAGIQLLLADAGVASVEFPHLMRLIQGNQFDTIYHEHFSYFSLITAQRVFAKHGLSIFDVEELPTHGGSLRLLLSHAGKRELSARVQEVINSELEFGLERMDTYTGFNRQVQETKQKLLAALAKIKESGSSIVAYGAPAKGNTLLNFCGIGENFLEYTVDRNPHKQGRFLPGTHLPIFVPEKLRETKPRYVLVLPWNIKEEVMEQTAFIRDWGAKFIVPIPEVEVLD